MSRILQAIAVVTALAAGPMSAVCSAEPAAAYDIVIRNGRLLDGLGNPWIKADLGIRDGRIARIGRIEAQGRREIDANDRYVSPGWIDMMDQSGEVLRTSGLAENKLLQGVTTAIAGEGGTPVPAAEIPAYFAQLESQGISLNFGTYYSAAQARVAVMGEGAGAPTPAQMEKMKALVAQAMQAGAVGIATALIFMMSEDDIETAVKAPWMGIGSDAAASERLGVMDALGLPHPRSYGNFPRVIAEYVRKRPVLTLEDAVRKMTSWPASRMKLFDRGALREGLWADVTVFDFERLQDNATYENPTAVPSGVDYVLVNGQIVIDQGHHTGAKPGKVLRRGGG